MTLSAFAVQRPVATSMFLLAGLLLGAVSLSRLEVTLLPELRAQHLLVWVAYPDAGVYEVEENVARPAEEAVVSARGVRDVRSTIVPGGVTLTVLLHPGEDPELTALGVRERLDAVRWLLPEDVERPIVLGSGSEETPDLLLALAAEDLHTAGTWAENVLRKRLEQIDGVARAQVVGRPQREITVVPDHDKMLAAGISASELALALREANVPSPGGILRQRGIRYSLRVESELQSAEEIRNVVVVPSSSRPIRVGEVATVTDGFEEPQGWSRLNHNPAVGIMVYREAGANLVAMAEAVHGQLTTMEADFPEFQVEVVADPSPFVKASMGGVSQAVWLGGLLAFLVLIVFLREMRSPLYLVLALPVSIVTTFAFLELAGVNLNLMSLGGLALGVGMLVDNSIICLENIHRLRNQGLPPRRAAAQGAQEVSLPMLASTLTSCSVFVPLAFVPGTVGALFRDQAITVSVSLGVSLVVALTLLPMLAGRLAPGALKEGALPLYGTYHRLLGRCLAHPKIFMTATAFLLVLSAVVLVERPREILPALRTDTVQIALRLPPGTDVQATDEVVSRAERWLAARPEVGDVFVSVGAVGNIDPTDPGQQMNRGSLRLRLTPEGISRRAQFLADVERDLEPRLECQVDIVEDRPELAAVFPRGETTLGLEILGPDPEQAEALTLRLARTANTYLDRSQHNLRLSLSELEPRLSLEPDRDTLWRLGLSEQILFDAIRARGSGLKATALRRFNDEIPVVIRQNLPPDSGDLVAQGRSFPIQELFETRRVSTPARLQREQQSRVASVRWDGALKDVGPVKEALESALAAEPLPPGYAGRWEGTYVEMQRTVSAILKALALSAGLVLLILAAQFESLRLPLLIFAAVPMALIGVALVLVLFGGTVNAFSGIGLVVLVGIVVNDSILKVDLIRRLCEQGTKPLEAVWTASRRRYRPIIMTTLTTALALSPVCLGAGSEFMAPLALTVIGGLLSATLLTLLAIPVLFLGLSAGRERRAARATAPRERTAGGAA